MKIGQTIIGGSYDYEVVMVDGSEITAKSVDGDVTLTFDKSEIHYHRGRYYTDAGYEYETGIPVGF